MYKQSSQLFSNFFYFFKILLNFGRFYSRLIEVKSFIRYREKRQ
jgi:hypothetical protein